MPIRKPVAKRQAHGPAPRWLAVLLAWWLAGSSVEPPPRARLPQDIRADIEALAPPEVARRSAWAVDLQPVLSGLHIGPTPERVCAVVPVVEQGSSFNADPPVPGLARVARAEIDRRADHAGGPSVAVKLALQLRASDGRTYVDRLASVKTERELSEIFGDFIGQVPLGQRLFGG